MIHVRTRKPALNTLLKKGCVGQEIWERLLRAEKELEAEVKDCAMEVREPIFRSCGGYIMRAKKYSRVSQSCLSFPYLGQFSDSLF